MEVTSYRPRHTNRAPLGSAVTVVVVYVASSMSSNDVKKNFLIFPLVGSAIGLLGGTREKEKWGKELLCGIPINSQIQHRRSHSKLKMKL